MVFIFLAICIFLLIFLRVGKLFLTSHTDLIVAQLNFFVYFLQGIFPRFFVFFVIQQGFFRSYMRQTVQIFVRLCYFFDIPCAFLFSYDDAELRELLRISCSRNPKTSQIPENPRKRLHFLRFSVQ